LAWAFLLEVAATRPFGFEPVGVRLCGYGLTGVEVGEDRVLADEWLFAGGNEDGDGLGAGAFAQQDAIVFLDRHLSGQVIDTELGEPLPDPP
jgi:hypothetical protein